jgi:uncharacterized protein (UPF0332 family)
MLKKSKQKFDSAIDDFKKGRYDSCVSNLYYSAFQTANAYLISANISQNITLMYALSLTEILPEKSSFLKNGKTL